MRYASSFRPINWTVVVLLYIRERYCLGIAYSSFSDFMEQRPHSVW